MRIIDTRTGAVTDAPVLDDSGNRSTSVIVVVGALTLIAAGLLLYARQYHVGSVVGGDDSPASRAGGVAGGQ